MQIHCPRCHAGPAALEPLTEILGDGTRLQTVRCLCGWRTSRQIIRHAPPQTPFAELTASRICSVAGCGRNYNLQDDLLPLCWVCKARLREWECGKQKKPAPVAFVDGVWIENRPSKRGPQQIKEATV